VGYGIKNNEAFSSVFTCPEETRGAASQVMISFKADSLLTNDSLPEHQYALFPEGGMRQFPTFSAVSIQYSLELAFLITGDFLHLATAIFRTEVD
jgi:hypothetical protein